MDELTKKKEETTGTTTSSAGDAYKTARTDAINKMYDAQKSQRESELKSAYDQSLSIYNAAQEKLRPTYVQRSNDLTTQNEREKRNFNQQAIGNGINTGAGSQAALARNAQYMRAMGNLKQSEAEETAEYERKKADLLTGYQNNLASAGAENDYQRTGALLDEYNNAYQRDMQNAQNLAQYGDFSGFERIYGADQAKNMLALWIAQNPDLAYNSGRINEQQYKVITGRDPVGWKATGVTINDLVDGRIPVKASAPSSGSGGGSVVWDGGINPYSPRESAYARGVGAAYDAAVSAGGTPTQAYWAATGSNYADGVTSNNIYMK